MPSPYSSMRLPHSLSRAGSEANARAVLSRRSLLAAGAGLLLAPRTAALAPLATGNFATFINLGGGNDALNTLIPTKLRSYARLRAPIAIGPDQGLDLDRGPYRNPYYVLHPALPTIAQLYGEGQAAFVRMIGYPGANASHSTCEDVWSRGARAVPERDSGWIARFKDIYAREQADVFALGLQGRLDFAGGETPSSFTLTPEQENRALFHGDSRFPANDVFRNQIVQARASVERFDDKQDRTRRALLLAYEQERLLGEGGGGGGSTGPTYPETDLGFALGWGASIQRRSLHSAKIFYARTFGPLFDTHFGQGGVEGDHADALGMIDEALAVYVEDLRALGLWHKAVILLFSEFGRRTATGGNGTDHGDGGLMIVLGGAIRGGMYGPDLREEHLEAANLPVEVDFRSVYAELLARHFDANPDLVFDEAYTRQPLGLFA